MILVAGLIIMGLAGIAAAFYFSMRPGSSRDRAVPERSRSRGSGRPLGSRPGAARPTGPNNSRSRTSPSAPSRPSRPASPARPGRSSRAAGGAPAAEGLGASTVLDFTDPQMDLGGPGTLVAGRRARYGGYQDDAPEETTQQIAALGSRPEDAVAADPAQRSRRRAGWRKGSDVDEELWPAKEFGGVSDEQFWDDLASDRPLATTARTAQPEATSRRRPAQGSRLPDLPAAEPGRHSAVQPAREERSAYPQRQAASEDRTAVQPAVAASQDPAYPAAAAYGAEPARPPASSGTADDPLTSPAYALRPKGAVDGRSTGSSPRSRPASAENAGRRRPEASWTSPLPSDRTRPGASGSGSYPGAPEPVSYPGGGSTWGSYPGVPSSGSYPAASGPGSYPGSSASGSYPGASVSGSYPAAAPSASPAHRPGSADSYRDSTAYLYPQAYGERAGSPGTGQYGYPDPGGPGGDPGYPNGGWRASQPGSRDDAARGARPAYPPGNGYRAPYDPGGYDRR